MKKNIVDRYKLKDITECKICGDIFDHLGSHIFHGHHMTAREYKAKFELDYKMPLISPAVREKKQRKFNLRREEYIANLMQSGRKYQFKKGHSGAIRRSQQTKERTRQIGLEALEQEKGICPVCQMGFDHISSHLFNAHGLQKVRKEAIQ